MGVSVAVVPRDVNVGTAEVRYPEGLRVLGSNDRAETLSTWGKTTVPSNFEYFRAERHCTLTTRI